MSIGALGSYSGFPISPTNANAQGCSHCRGDKSGETDAGGEPKEEHKRQVVELKRTDAEVKAHEAAHVAAGGQYAGGATFQYQTGPDGKRYAVGGEVPIDTSPVSGDPRATIRKMQTVRRAALAPAEPSGQDRAVASAAAATEAKARQELSEQKKSDRAGPAADTEAAGEKGKEKEAGTYDGAAKRSQRLESSFDLIA